MKIFHLFLFLFLSALVTAQTRYDVSSGAEFSAAQSAAVAGDSIVWASGTYTDTRMEIDKDGLVITAESSGTVLFTGVSRAVINGNNITFSGFQYIGGFIGSLDVIRVYGDDILITQVNIQNYTCFKYLVVYESARRVTISYCNFENRLNLDDKNILSILVSNEPGYHKIQHCSFKNFVGIGADQGIEPIRIGLSSQGNRDSRTLVEYCYFTQCNGDGEIISHKSRQNVYRYNTFEDNPVAELVLRHGDEGIVYGNFFLNNMGGIRVREGSSHYIYNNYFEGLDRRSIFLQNESSDPLSDIHIYHNTIVNSEEMVLGSSGGNPPTNVTIANNVFADPLENLFIQDTENETWINNITMGNVGIDLPATGLTAMDPQLYVNGEGYSQPASDSPVIASASSGYPEVPLFPGMDYDNEISLDLMKQARPSSITERAIGASEYSDMDNVQPHATEMNSGPFYLFDNLVNYVTANVSQLYMSKDGESRAIKISSNVDWTVMESAEWITADLASGSGDAQLIISVGANPEADSRSGTLTVGSGTDMVTIQVNQDAGPVSVIDDELSEVFLFPNPTNGAVTLSDIPSGINRALIEIINVEGRYIFSNDYRISNNELSFDLDKLASGTYFMNVRFIGFYGQESSIIMRKLVVN